MTTGPSDLLPICRRLLEWARATGGWEAPVWDELREAVERETTVQPEPPTPGDRVLRLQIDGVLDVRIPPETDEDGPNWDDWLDRAIQAALVDGRWQECTSVSESEVGVLDEYGQVR